jgi:hypothetical protein
VISPFRTIVCQLMFLLTISTIMAIANIEKNNMSIRYFITRKLIPAMINISEIVT